MSTKRRRRFRSKAARKRYYRRLYTRIAILILLVIVVVAAIVLIHNRRKNNRKSNNAVENTSIASQNDGTAVSDNSTAAAGTQDNGNNADGNNADGNNAESASSEGGNDAAAVETPAETDPLAELKAKKPDIDINSWEYVLANPWNSIQDYVPYTEAIEDISLDARIIPAMQEFVQGARNQGLNVLLASGYRSYSDQTWLFENKVQQYDGDEEVAATIVARPGTSEHQTGLAADITDDYYELKQPEVLELTELYKWMSAHCQEYGFIVRFPKGKEDVTGIIYEPWHFRYVGVEAATFIMENNLTLEEFHELYGDDIAEAPVTPAATPAG